MAKLKWEKVKPEDLLDVDELVQSFKEYCMKRLDYDEFEAEIAASDMKDPEEQEAVTISMPDETVGSYTRANKKYYVYQK